MSILRKVLSAIYRFGMTGAIQDLSNYEELMKYSRKNYPFDPVRCCLSYSQTGEDRIINLIRKQLRLKQFFYVDIGACHGVSLSNTYLFYLMGFRGLLVEANPLLLERIRKTRREDILCNVGIVPEYENNKRQMEFYVLSSNAMSTFHKKGADYLVENQGYSIKDVIKVDVLTINDFLRKYVKEKINMLSIDIEGLDLPVLEKYDYNQYRPDIICVETLTREKKKDGSIAALIESKEYFKFADTYINTIFVDRRRWLDTVGTVP